MRKSKVNGGYSIARFDDRKVTIKNKGDLRSLWPLK